MRQKLLNIGLLITSLFGYLEWGDNQMFLIQLELDVISKFISDPGSVIHPLTTLPLIGQICLIITLFQKTPSKTLTLLGLSGIAVLFIVILIVGLISSRISIALSTIPFFCIALIVFRSFVLKRKSPNP